jgi:hypothetical protein
VSTRRRPAPRENPERWAISYADFITLLFAVFTVLYAISAVDARRAQQLVRAIEESFDMEPRNTIYPGAADTWYDGIDQDCNGANDFDQDGDSYTATSAGGADCDDADGAVNPVAIEVYYDGVDGNCDGRDDLVYVTRETPSNAVCARLGNGLGGLSGPVRTLVPFGITGAALGRLDSDGLADLAVWRASVRLCSGVASQRASCSATRSDERRCASTSLRRKCRCTNRPRVRPIWSLRAAMIAVCGIGRPNGCLNSAVTANQSASPPTIAASAVARSAPIPQKPSW